MSDSTSVVVLIVLVVLAGPLSGCSSVSDRKATSTATAVGALQKQVEDGTIQIEGETDTAPPP